MHHHDHRYHLVISRVLDLDANNMNFNSRIWLILKPPNDMNDNTNFSRHIFEVINSPTEFKLTTRLVLVAWSCFGEWITETSPICDYCVV